MFAKHYEAGVAVVCEDGYLKRGYIEHEHWLVLRLTKLNKPPSNVVLTEDDKVWQIAQASLVAWSPATYNHFLYFAVGPYGNTDAEREWAVPSPDEPPKLTQDTRERYRMGVWVYGNGLSENERKMERVFDPEILERPVSADSVALRKMWRWIPGAMRRRKGSEEARMRESQFARGLAQEYAKQLEHLHSDADAGHFSPLSQEFLHNLFDETLGFRLVGGYSTSLWKAPSFG